MIFRFAFPDRQTAAKLLSDKSISMDITDDDGNARQLKSRSVGHGLVCLLGELHGAPVDTKRKDAEGFAVMKRGPVMKSALGRTYHVDMILYPPDVEVVGYTGKGDDMRPIWSGPLIDAAADYLVTPDNPSITYAGLG